MLQLHSNCECCDIDLPLESTETSICSYECTFCTDCVEGILQNVCPNCGGAFVPKPIRPRIEHRPGVGISNAPASVRRIVTVYSRDELTEFCNSIKHIAPENR